MNRRRLVHIIVLVTLLFPAGAIAQPMQPLSISAQEIRLELGEYRGELEAWEKNVKVLIALAAAVALLGIGSSAAQYLRENRAKIVAVTAGIAVTLITSVTNLFYQVDHWTLKRTINRAEDLLNDIERQLISFERVPEGQLRRDIQNQITEKLNRLGLLRGEIRDKVLLGYRLANGVAFAQASQDPLTPSWAERPEGPGGFSVAGRGSAPYPGTGGPEVARRLALEEAKAKLRARIVAAWANPPAGAKTLQPPLTPDALASQLVSVASVADEFVGYDAANGSVVHWVLLSLGAKTASIMLNELAKRQGTVVPDWYRERIAAR
jgi:hypothetical protein